jgi:hypothetical protein
MDCRLPLYKKRAEWDIRDLVMRIAGSGATGASWSKPEETKLWTRNVSVKQVTVCINGNIMWNEMTSDGWQF